MRNKDARFRDPVIIVGAPRSGTSMLQRILRGYPGFVSVAKESGHIWRRYTHPSVHDWRSESCDVESMTEGDVQKLQRSFARYALPSSTWVKADAQDVLRYQRNPLLSALVFRPAYHALALARSVVASRTLDMRLVDKSVHSRMWLPLVDLVFPDATYVHIVRNPRQTLRSMIAGWLNPSRFFTYRLPRDLRIPDYPHDRWNFVLPPGWEGMITNRWLGWWRTNGRPSNRG